MYSMEFDIIVYVIVRQCLAGFYKIYFSHKGMVYKVGDMGTMYYTNNDRIIGVDIK